MALALALALAKRVGIVSILVIAHGDEPLGDPMARQRVRAALAAWFLIGATGVCLAGSGDGLSPSKRVTGNDRTGEMMSFLLRQSTFHGADRPVINQTYTAQPPARGRSPNGL